MVQEHVDIITFYNEIFIPTVKPLLVELAPARDVTEDKNNANGMNSNFSNHISMLHEGFLMHCLMSFYCI